MKQKMTLLAFLIGTSLFSQNSKPAETLLNEVYATAQSYKNISVDFKYVLENDSEDIKQETSINNDAAEYKDSDVGAPGTIAGDSEAEAVVLDSQVSKGI